MEIDGSDKFRYNMRDHNISFKKRNFVNLFRRE
jgi:hypothetical protein